MYLKKILKECFSCLLALSFLEHFLVAIYFSILFSLSLTILYGSKPKACFFDSRSSRFNLSLFRVQKDHPLANMPRLKFSGISLVLFHSVLICVCLCHAPEKSNRYIQFSLLSKKNAKIDTLKGRLLSSYECNLCRKFCWRVVCVMYGKQKFFSLLWLIQDMCFKSKKQN